MSLYGGFGNKQLESEYNINLSQMLQLLCIQIEKILKGDTVDNLLFKKLFLQLYESILTLESSKYLNPKFSENLKELAHFLKQTKLNLSNKKVNTPIQHLQTNGIKNESIVIPHYAIRQIYKYQNGSRVTNANQNFASNSPSNCATISNTNSSSHNNIASTPKYNAVSNYISNVSTKSRFNDTKIPISNGSPTSLNIKKSVQYENDKFSLENIKQIQQNLKMKEQSTHIKALSHQYDSQQHKEIPLKPSLKLQQSVKPNNEITINSATNEKTQFNCGLINEFQKNKLIISKLIIPNNQTPVQRISTPLPGAIAIQHINHFPQNHNQSQSIEQYSSNDDMPQQCSKYLISPTGSNQSIDLAVIQSHQRKNIKKRYQTPAINRTNHNNQITSIHQYISYSKKKKPLSILSADESI